MHRNTKANFANISRNRAITVVCILSQGLILQSCKKSVTETPLNGSSPASFAPNIPSTPQQSTPAGFVFSPYKDVSINLDWNSNVISTMVAGSMETMLAAMPSKENTLTWAFATGTCDAEDWSGLSGTTLASANVSGWVAAGKKYIISTGGAAGTFTCTNDASFTSFINRYYSANLVGVDFDIESGQSQTDINNLVQRVIIAEQSFPNLRFSFTVGTLGGNVSPSLGTYGVRVMQAIQKYGLRKYYINLMAMDYGSSNGGNCMTDSYGQCDMGQSAIQSAIDLNNQYGVPFNQIEVTAMIGGNVSTDEVFTLADAQALSSFALQKGLAGIHFWSFDRDTDCVSGAASPTCNTYNHAGTLGFTNAFLSGLGY